MLDRKNARERTPAKECRQPLGGVGAVGRIREHEVVRRGGKPLGKPERVTPVHDRLGTQAEARDVGAERVEGSGRELDEVGRDRPPR